MQRIIDELKKNETIIQTTLVNAQKLAMQLTDEAKQNAEQTLAEAQANAQAVTADADAKACRRGKNQGAEILFQTFHNHQNIHQILIYHILHIFLIPKKLP